MQSIHTSYQIQEFIMKPNAGEVRSNALTHTHTHTHTHTCLLYTSDAADE